MLDAIDAAHGSVCLLSYIFEYCEVGRRFIAALARAQARGVQVRVLVDDAGSPDTAVDRELRLAGVRIERFLPVRLLRRVDSFNLRNHRKLLIVDGRVGFTGGLNIHQSHVLESDPAWPILDTHFRFEGPVVRHFQEVFAEDWGFTRGEVRHDLVAPAESSGAGVVFARGLAEGPDEDLDALRLTLLSALSVARQSVGIVTPYFLPDEALITAIRVASLRGITIDIVLPSRSDVRVVDYASRAHLWHVLNANTRVWISPLPFDHSKLMVVDDYWSFVGSANWDPRSLRLNFEFNVECYDRELAQQIRRVVDERIGRSQPLSRETLEGLPLSIRLRNGVCRLAMPYI
jgi:cardiolipin synthase